MSSFLARLREALMSIIAAISRRQGSGGGGTPPVTPVLTTIVLSGATSVVATHTTVFSAAGKDQNGASFGLTPVYASGTPSHATIGSSSGIATGVAAGTSSITASSVNSLGATITSNAITLTTAAQVPTSPIVVSPSSFTVGVGATQALSAVVSDQGSPANVISGATVNWSSATPANATVNSSTGVVTGVANGSSVITATSGSATGTSTATVTAFSPSTGAFIGGSNGAIPIAYDAAVIYASDNTTLPKWRDVFALKNTSPGNYPEWIYSDQSKNGTIPSPWTGAKYTFDTYCDLAIWQNSVLSFNGDPMFQITMIGDNLGHSAPIAQLRGPITGVRSLWVWHRRKMAGWTAVGDATSPAGTSFNSGQAKSYKLGGAAAFNTSNGRASLEVSSGSGHSGQYEYEFTPIVGSTAYGVSGSVPGNITPIWDVGAPEYDHISYWHGYTTGGVDHVAVRNWRKLSTDPISSFTELGTVADAALPGTVPTPMFGNVTGLTGLNMNQSFSTNQSYYVWGWAAWNPLQDASSADPFGVL